MTLLVEFGLCCHNSYSHDRDGSVSESRVWVPDFDGSLTLETKHGPGAKSDLKLCRPR